MLKASGFTFLAKGEKQPAPPRARIALTPAEIDDAYDYPLTWREALKRIYGVVKSRDTFKRLRTEGALINGVRIKLGTVRRPNGHVARVSDVENFIAACEAAEQTTRDTPPGAAGVGSGSNAGVGGPQRDTARLSPGGRASIAAKSGGYLPAPRNTSVGRRLDVSA